MKIDKNMSVKEIIEKYPESMQVFLNYGFKNLDQQENLEKLKDISLEKIFQIKNQDVNLFLNLLENIIVEKDEREKNAKILGLLPCPVRIPLIEAFEKFLTENDEISVDYELKAASSGLGFIKEKVKSSKNSEDIADMFMSAGFDLFFDKELFGKYKAEGVFKDLTGIEKYNIQFENEEINLRDPKGDYSMIAVVPAVFIVNTKVLKGRLVPQSWKDLLKEEYKNSVSIPISDFDLFNAIILNIYKNYDYEGVKHLGRSLLYNMHPAQMVEAEEPLVTVMPMFFSKMIDENSHKKVIWPDDGAIISPIFMLTKKSKEKELKKIIDFMSGEKVAKILSHQGLFPSVNPNIENIVGINKKFLWLGWDFINKNDLSELMKILKEKFNEGVNS